jgi:hypothetical protein
MNSVDQGVGLNMYYSNLSSDSPKWLTICVDSLVGQRLIGKTIDLSPESKDRNDATIKYYKRLLVLHTVKSTVKYPSRVAKAMADLIRKDALAAISLTPFIFFKAITFVAAKFAEIGRASWRSKTRGSEPATPRGN